jgi:hypothetical protein
MGLPLLLQGQDRRLRIKNFVLLWLVTVAIAAIWWVPVWDTVTGYLTSTGYGSEATGYGLEHSITSGDYWTSELKLVVNYLYLPLSLTLVACLIAAAAFALATPRRGISWRAAVRRLVGSGAFLLVMVVVEGYLALTSTANQGTAFPLPWLPSLVILGLAAAAAIPTRAVRLGLAALLVGVCGANLVAKNGVSNWLSQPRFATVPLVDRVTVLDGRDFMYASLDGRGYPVRPPPARLPQMYKHWSTLNDELVRFMTGYAAKRNRAPFVVVGTGDCSSTTRA